MTELKGAQVAAQKQTLIVCIAETTQTLLAYISISYERTIIRVAKPQGHCNYDSTDKHWSQPQLCLSVSTKEGLLHFSPLMSNQNQKLQISSFCRDRISQKYSISYTRTIKLNLLICKLIQLVLFSFLERIDIRQNTVKMISEDQLVKADFTVEYTEMGQKTHTVFYIAQLSSFDLISVSMQLMGSDLFVFVCSTFSQFVSQKA